MFELSLPSCIWYLDMLSTIRRRCSCKGSNQPSYFFDSVLAMSCTNTTSAKTDALSTYASIILSRLHVVVERMMTDINNLIPKRVVGGQYIEQSCRKVSIEDHGL